MASAAPLEKFKSHLGKTRHRVTRQRLAVFQAAMSQKDHFTADQLLDLARALDKSVSRATVYRTLPIMVKSALLREVDVGANNKYYRPNPADSRAQVAQIVCADCNRLFEIEAPYMEWYGVRAAARLGLTPVSQRLQVQATCNALAAGRPCANKK
ncbi:MAG: transcriptional repressor [Opitutaceae bacterium]|jgi:Fur family ferric uptake transcriptional regulator|nr:transcriptional repressor [Opitutaceae bacterium]